MEYKIRIEPNKIQEFLQIIQSLQNLGVVKDLNILADSNKTGKENYLSPYGKLLSKQV